MAIVGKIDGTYIGESELRAICRSLIDYVSPEMVVDRGREGIAAGGTQAREAHG